MSKQDTHMSWFILVPYSWVLFFLFIPSFLLIGLSISGHSNTIPPYEFFIHWEDYLWPTIKPVWSHFYLIISDPLYISAFLDSFILASMATIFSLLIGYPMAYAISRAHQRWHNLLILLVVLPFWTASLIRIYAWIILLRDNGLMNHWLMSASLIDVPLHIMHHKIAVIIGLVYIYLPFMVLPIYSSLTKIPPSLREAASDLGCTPLETFWHVTLPLSKLGIITGCTFVFLPTMGEFVIPDLLGGTKVLTIGKVVWNEFFFTNDWPVAACMSIAMIVIIVLPITIVQRRKL